jgi:hypothetical protein
MIAGFVSFVRVHVFFQWVSYRLVFVRVSVLLNLCFLGFVRVKAVEKLIYADFEKHKMNKHTNKQNK